MKKYNIISNSDPKSHITEAYRKLRTNIDFSSIDKKVKVVNVTSTNPEEGKTLTCLNLATVYAQTGKKVALLDLDLRKSKIHRAFQIRNKNGISDYLTNEIDIKDIVYKSAIGIDVFVSGSEVPFPTELINSQKFSKLMEIIRNEYDHVIIDCPPLSAAFDAIIISSHVDGTIFTVASRKTHKDAAKHMVKSLKDNNANVIGVVLTRVEKNDIGYYGNYSYYGND